MKPSRWILAGVTAMLPVATAATFGLLSAGVWAAEQGTKPPMSFFVTSMGKSDGANLGGLAGADAHCQALAAAVGRGNVTWHAYLSTQGAGAVNARDRIGKGPWFNATGQLVAKGVDDLHASASGGWSASGTAPLAVNEQGAVVPGEGHTPNLHDVLTGSKPDGRAFTDADDHTCMNWTSNSTGTAYMGHSDLLDRNSNGRPTSSWNSAHPSRADCSQKGMETTGMGAGLFYCFAVN